MRRADGPVRALGDLNQTRPIPNALTIAGSDSGGGAGIQADLKTFSALGVYGASVITAVTAQNTREVRGIHDVPPGFVATQIDAVFADLCIDAVKVGMLSRPEVITEVADALDRHHPSPIVLDPVMIAKSGDHLLQNDAIASLREALVPRATLITPNLPEAGVLLGEAPPRDEAEMRSACFRLQTLGAEAVLLKGGHLGGPRSIDLLVWRGEIRRFASPRLSTTHTHGTGCTLSSAIAAGLAHGFDLLDAVARAKAYVSAAIEAAARLRVGGGHGPVHHFHAWWSTEQHDPS